MVIFIVVGVGAAMGVAVGVAVGVGVAMGVAARPSICERGFKVRPGRSGDWSLS